MNENDIQKNNSRRLLVIEIAAILIFVLQAVTTALVLPRAIKAMDAVTELSDRADEVIDNADKTITEVNEAIQHVESSLDTADKILDSTTELFDANTEKLTEAVDRLSELNFDDLNASVEALRKVLEPLARLTGGRGETSASS